MPTDDIAVNVSGLTVKFGDFTAVDDISFSVRKGEIFGFLGANGAGKTTTIRVLCGLLVPTSGRVEIAGLDFSHGVQEIKKKVGYMSQRFTLYNDLTVMENIQFAASLRKLDEDKLKIRIRELFEFIDFEHPENTFVQDLPGGIKQQVSLVAAILHDPEIVFLDEPTAGVSPASRARFWALIRKLAGSGKTVFVTTHYMDEAEECERIALMRAGKIIALDSPRGLEDKAFPEPLFEIEPEEGARAALQDAFGKNEIFRGVRPHGMRYHLVVRDKTAWSEISKRMEKLFTARQIQPSLEDVFIRLVEGKSE